MGTPKPAPDRAGITSVTGDKGECGEFGVAPWRPEPDPSHSTGGAMEQMLEGNNSDCGAEFQHKDPLKLSCDYLRSLHHLDVLRNQRKSIQIRC